MGIKRDTKSSYPGLRVMTGPGKIRAAEGFPRSKVTNTK